MFGGDKEEEPLLGQIKYLEVPGLFGTKYVHPLLQQTFMDVLTGLEIITVRRDPEDNMPWSASMVLYVLEVLYKILKGKTGLRLVSRYTSRDLSAEKAEKFNSSFMPSLNAIPKKKEISACVWERWISLGLIEKKPDMLDTVEELFLFEVDLLA